MREGAHLKQDNVLLGRYYWYRKGHYQTWLQEWSEHLPEKAESQLEQKSPLKQTAGWRSETDLFCFGDDEGFTIEAWLHGSKLMRKKLPGVVSYCWDWKAHIKRTWTEGSPLPEKMEKYSLYSLYVAYSQQTLTGKTRKIKLAQSYKKVKIKQNETLRSK